MQRIDCLSCVDKCFNGPQEDVKNVKNNSFVLLHLVLIKRFQTMDQVEIILDFVSETYVVAVTLGTEYIAFQVPEKCCKWPRSFQSLYYIQLYNN